MVVVAAAVAAVVAAAVVVASSSSPRRPVVVVVVDDEAEVVLVVAVVAAVGRVAVGELGLPPETCFFVKSMLKKEPFAQLGTKSGNKNMEAEKIKTIVLRN